MQDGQVHIDQFGLIKSTLHIFVLHKVHAGLPADAAVYLGKQRGRHLDKINAAQVGRRRKTGKIADNAAASKRQKQILTVKMLLDQRLVQSVHRLKILLFSALKRGK